MRRCIENRTNYPIGQDTALCAKLFFVFGEQDVVLKWRVDL
jgi:hypothetical protein